MRGMCPRMAFSPAFSLDKQLIKTQSEAYMRLGNKDDQSVQVQVVNCQRLVDYS